MAINKVILVGHCGADTSTLEWVVSRAAEGVAIDTAHSTAELARAAQAGSLLLVNRVLDGSFDTGSGVELIGRLAKSANPPVMMLISNYPEAQEQAIKAGARPGFGKSQADDEATAALLREALGI